ncbi:MAG TPA: ATP-binding protein [Ktedonosporobacter sp.]|jgi:predicted kinase|nr:ATP-binding protein [Ktedonosporobacter sp.]
MEIVILIGLQAAGKSTFYQAHCAHTHEHVSKDLLRNNKRPAQRQSQLIEEALQAGRSVVVDNTNPSPEDRAQLIHLGRQYGAEIVGYYFEPQVKQSLERNRQRAGKARVPDVAIFATRKKLTRPTYAEGFDKLYSVRSGQDTLFEIVDWAGDDVID